MSRLPSLTPSKVLRVLKKVGFIEIGQKGSHIKLFNSSSNYRTVIPLHGKDLKRSLLKEIIKQASLTESEFIKLL